ncbi:MAG: AraC family transcriptional regulator [Clostridia bacterium]|nr:AraC family transcriptional regulator [Clostridia bacterium]
MRNIISGYTSKNGIRFHHSVSTHDSTDQDTLMPESHHMYEIILLLSGSATYKIEGRSYNLSPLDAIIIHPNKLHSREFDASCPYERMVLHFAPDLLPSFADLNLLSNYNDFFMPSVLPKKIIEQSNFISQMHQCEALCYNVNKYTDLHLVSLILQIVETLNEIILKLDETDMLLPVKTNKISSDCIQYINKNLTNIDNLSPQNLAKELYISVSHLQHTFKKEIGISLHAYIYNQRMQLARKLLSQGQSPQSVANMLNYDYYSTFYHSFVKRFGVPPHFFNVQKSASEKIKE